MRMCVHFVCVPLVCVHVVCVPLVCVHGVCVPLVCVHVVCVRVQVRRVGFKMPPQNLEEALSLFMKLFQECYERQQGWLE